MALSAGGVDFPEASGPGRVTAIRLVGAWSRRRDTYANYTGGTPGEVVLNRRLMDNQGQGVAG